MAMESNFLSRDEFRVFLDRAKTGRESWAREAYDLFWFLGNFGSRISEALLSTFADFKGVSQWNTVRLWRLKKGKALRDRKGKVIRKDGRPLREFLPPQPDEIPLAPNEGKVVLDLVARRRTVSHGERLFNMSVRRAQYLFTYYLTVTGLKDRKPYLSLHSLRHTCGTLLYEDTGDLEFVRRRLGHSSLSSVQRYVRNSPKRQIELGAKRTIIS